MPKLISFEETIPTLLKGGEVYIVCLEQVTATGGKTDGK